ncbi:hypothetical protein [Paraglaciecola sp. 25GB23A]|uniref:hypothetical protein n=1 Tax=Paraglaciecola sp. 25GB23A TaxID=3156068 RepID=UPI0032AF7A6D
MKSLVFLALTIAFSPFTFAGFSLSGQPVISEEAYNAQLAIINEKVRKSIKITGSMEVYEDELTIAPLVLYIDFQKLIKVAQGASVLGEYSSWIDLELATWGFQEVVDRADEKIVKELETRLGGTVYPIDDATESAAATFIVIPPNMPDLNKKMPNYKKTLIAYESFGFDAEDNVKATQIELADMDENEGVVFFPYINLALHKQSATTSQMNGELMINYKAAMNGYFALCIKAGCFKAALPNHSYIDLVIPLVHRKEATSDETQMAALEYSQELMAQMITEFTMAAFEKLSAPDPE